MRSRSLLVFSGSCCLSGCALGVARFVRVHLSHPVHAVCRCIRSGSSD